MSKGLLRGGVIKMNALLLVGAACIILLGGIVQRNRTAEPYQTAVGETKKSSGNTLMLDWNPCGTEKILTFRDNYRVKEMGTRTCNSGKTYKAVRVTQCGGPNDGNNPICRAPN